MCIYGFSNSDLEALSAVDQFFNLYFEEMYTINAKYNKDFAAEMYKLFTLEIEDFENEHNIINFNRHVKNTILLIDILMHFYKQINSGVEYEALCKEYFSLIWKMSSHIFDLKLSCCENMPDIKKQHPPYFKMHNNIINIMIMFIIDESKPDFASLLSSTITPDKITEYNKNIAIINNPKWQEMVSQLFVEISHPHKIILGFDPEHNINFNNKTNVATGLPNGFFAMDVMSEGRQQFSYDKYLELGRKITIAGINPLYTRFTNAQKSTIVVVVKDFITELKDLKDTRELVGKLILKLQQVK